MSATKHPPSTGNVIADAFAAQDAAIRWAESVKQAETAIAKARIRLICDNSAKGLYFSYLAMKLECVPTARVQTMAVDGKRLFFNPDFTNGLTADECLGVVVHEVLHCAFLHFARRNGRPVGGWNIATDLSINDILRDNGYTLPSGVLFPGEKEFKKFPKGLSAEEYFALLPQDKQDGSGQGDGDGDGRGDDPGGSGGVIDPQDAAASTAAAADWEIAAKAAAQIAERRGDVPGSLGRLIGKVGEPRVDWRAELREFLTVKRPERNCWSTPNRRYLPMGWYFPTLTGEAVGHVVVAIDTSGSIGDEVLAKFFGEITGILGQNPSKLTVIWCDCVIGRIDEYDDTGSEELRQDPCGGGGTSHIPVFAHVEGLLTSEAPPEVVVCLTDLETDFPQDGCSIPTLWVSTTKGRQAPFGKTIELRD